MAQKTITELGTINQLKVNDEFAVYDKTNNLTKKSTVNEFLNLASANAIPPGFILGGLPILDATEPEKLIGFKDLLCRTHDNLAVITNSNNIYKYLDQNWAKNTSSYLGGMPAGLSVQANTTYHFFCIVNEATGEVDAGFDTSITAFNLMNDSNVVTAGFDSYRRVCSFITDASSNIIPFNSYLSGKKVQIVYKGAGIADVPAISGTATDYTLSIPVAKDIKLFWRVYKDTSISQQYVYYDDGDGEKALLSVHTGSSSGNTSSADVLIKTSTGQIKLRNTGSLSIWNTYGYEDERD